MPRYGSERLLSESSGSSIRLCRRLVDRPLAAGRPEVQSIEVDHLFTGEAVEIDLATGKDGSEGNFGRDSVDGNDEGRVSLCFLEGTIGGRKAEGRVSGPAQDSARKVMPSRLATLPGTPDTLPSKTVGPTEVFDPKTSTWPSKTCSNTNMVPAVGRESGR